MRALTPYKLPYRPDIDGLRAVAVLAVILGHFGLPLRGGFVGVDVFFVISGFLIGGLLWREYDDTGRIALGRFFLGRIRRLAPAFFLMLAGVGVIGWFILLPFEYRELGKSAIAATVYLSNVFFYRQAGYFETISVEKPLLHTWSLAVEEQFYLMLPLVILLLVRWRWGVIGALVALWAGSLVACVLLTPHAPDAAFFLFPFRAWELLSGVLLAIWAYETDRDLRGYAPLSWLGFALIILAILVTPEGRAFPGALALVPVIGTVLLLGNRAGRINHLLSHRYVVLIGMMSYSLYLWHWPVFSLSHYLRAGYAFVLEPALWLIPVFGLAWVSWRYVETPIRRAIWVPNPAVLAGAAVLSATTLAVGFWIYQTEGQPDRFDGGVRAHMVASTDFLQDWQRCETAKGLPLDGLKVCHIGPEGPPKLLVWGDSHALAFKGGIDKQAQDTGTPGVIVWRPGCAPLIGVRKVESMDTREGDTACTQSNTQVKQAFGRLESVETVLLMGRWAYYASGEGSGIDKHFRIAMYPTEGPKRLDQSQPDLIAQAAENTVQLLEQWGLRVAVMRQPPEFPDYDSRRAAREAAHLGNPLAALPVTQSVLTLKNLETRRQLADAPWVPIVQAGRVKWLDPWPYLCAQATCSVVVQGAGQYFDNDHVTNTAALRMAPLFDPIFTAKSGMSLFTGTSE
jgi:peptidoglycan/LPS O-acetylase OafA/YrhL